MPKFLEDKLRAEYGNNARAVYGTMNKLGVMHGNQETAKGRKMEEKHEATMKKPPFHSTRIEHHDDGSHTVTHEPHMKPTKGGAFYDRGESSSYSAEDGPSLMSKLQDKLKIKEGGPEKEEAGEGHDDEEVE